MGKWYLPAIPFFKDIVYLISVFAIKSLVHILLQAICADSWDLGEPHPTLLSEKSFGSATGLSSRQV